MGVIKEPKNVDMSMKSAPWTKRELADFRKLMQEIKSKNAKPGKSSKNNSTRLTPA